MPIFNLSCVSILIFYWVCSRGFVCVCVCVCGFVVVVCFVFWGVGGRRKSPCVSVRAHVCVRAAFLLCVCARARAPVSNLVVFLLPVNQGDARYEYVTLTQHCNSIFFSSHSFRILNNSFFPSFFLLLFFFFFFDPFIYKLSGNRDCWQGFCSFFVAMI